MARLLRARRRARGRVRTSPARRNAILDEFERSGGSGAQFAAHLGIKYPTFASWVAQRRRERGGQREDAAPALRWVEALVETTPRTTAPPSGAVRIHLPGGAVMELADAAQTGLIAALLIRLAGGESSLC